MSESHSLLRLARVAITGIGAILFRRTTKSPRTLRLRKSTPKKPPPRGSGHLGSQPYHWNTSAPSQKKNPFLQLTLPITQDLRFTLRRRQALDRLGIRLGITRQPTFHDPDFDTRLFLNTPHLHAVSTLFSRSAPRAAALSLITRGFTHLVLNRKGLHLKWIPYKPGPNPVSPEEMDELATRLQVVLKATLQTHLPEEDQTAARNWRRALITLYTVSGVGMLAGLGALISGTLLFPPLDPGRVFLAGLSWPIIATIFWVWLLYNRLKGTTGAHAHALALANLGLCAAILLAQGGMLWLNAHFDTSPPIAHQALVIHKKITRSKNRRTYHLNCASWRTPGTNEHLKVSRTLYQRIRPGLDSMEIVTRKGHLGYEWLVSFRLSPNEKAPFSPHTHAPSPGEPPNGFPGGQTPQTTGLEPPHDASPSVPAKAVRAHHLPR